MNLLTAALAVELVPHCTSVARDGWAGSHDVRPLAELGRRQAAALATAIGGNVDGVYSSPTARCRQTVGPLAASVGLPVNDLAELYEADDFGEPAAGVDKVPELMVHALGGAWAAGRMLRAVAIMMHAHPGGRVVAASHGDVVPVLLATLGSAFGLPRPRHVGRGGWYTLQFAAGDVAITAHDPVRALARALAADEREDAAESHFARCRGGFARHGQPSLVLRVRDRADVPVRQRQHAEPTRSGGPMDQLKQQLPHDRSVRAAQ